MFPESAYYLIAAWLFLLGATFGSFFNVVVYRVPEGMSLIRPGSHCPACKHPIRWFDNVPLVGWCLLRAKCRDCGVAISARYPLVEAMTAGMFLALGVAEYLSRGANLPLRPVALADAVIFPEWTFSQATAVYAYHLLLLSTLWVAALIEFDGRRVPFRLAVPAFVVGLLAPAVWPYLHPVPACRAMQGWLVDGLAGLATGLALGWLAAVMPRRLFGRVTKFDGQSPAGEGAERTTVGQWLMCPACTGLFLGWQAVAVVTLISVALGVILAMVARRLPTVGRIGPAGWMMTVALAWILCWSRLVEQWPVWAGM